MAHKHPKYIRKHRVNLSLNDSEKELIDRICELCGGEPTTYVREKAFEKIYEELKAQNIQNAAQ